MVRPTQRDKQAFTLTLTPIELLFSLAFVFALWEEPGEPEEKPHKHFYNNTLTYFSMRKFEAHKYSKGGHCFSVAMESSAVTITYQTPAAAIA